MVHEYSKGISHIKPQAMQIYNWLLNDYFSVYLAYPYVGKMKQDCSSVNLRLYTFIRHALC